MNNFFRKIENLAFENEFGGFDLENNEYVIVQTKDKFTPRPWSNVIVNKNFGTLVTESSLATTWVKNSKDKRVSPWSNDTVSDIPSEIIYVKDNESKEFWSITRNPIGKSESENGKYITRHGNGYSIFENTTHEIDHEMTVLVDSDDPIKIIFIRLKNNSSQKRKLSFYYYVDLVLGNYKNQFSSFIHSEFNHELNTVIVERTDKKDFKEKIFVSSNAQISANVANKNDFIGYLGSFSKPVGLISENLETSKAHPKDNCVVVKVDIEIEAGEEKSLEFFLGAGNDMDHLTSILNKYRQNGESISSLTKVKNFWKDINSRVVINTPDKTIDVMFNNWLVYQTLSCRIWGRTSFYQASGAYGYRDQLQDSMIFAYVDPKLLREHIIRAAARQFEEGDVQHWWFDDTGIGVRNRVADSPLWLAYVTSFYIEKTGDRSIFDEVIPYIKGKPLTEGVDAYVDVPQISELKEPLFWHCIKAIEKTTDFGIHGLPLIKEGDWNDGMNMVGKDGKGESVWLGWFLGNVLQDFINYTKERGHEDISEKFLGIYDNLRHSLHISAWDGEWYLRAYADDGHRLGSAGNIDCKIDSISQSWSVISGMDDYDRQIRAMDSALKYLIDKKYGLAKLLDPAFDKDPINPGYIKDYVPGIRENGGQYSHAAFWLVMALARLKQGEIAELILNFTNPIRRTDMKEKLWAYELEPYVIGGDIYASEQHMAKGGWSWYSASSGLMFRTILESILGFKLFGNRVAFDPCIPQDWKEFSINYKFKSATYNIKFTVAQDHQNKVTKVSVDGHEFESMQLMLEDDGKVHEVEVRVE